MVAFASENNRYEIAHQLDKSIVAITDFQLKRELARLLERVKAAAP